MNEQVMLYGRCNACVCVCLAFILMIYDCFILRFLLLIVLKCKNNDRKKKFGGNFFNN